MRKTFLLVIALLWAGVAQAAFIEPVKGNLFATEDGYALSANFAFDLGPYIEETITRGVPLYFNLELDVTRPRRYWVEEHVLGYALTYRVSYNALTRQYRLSTGALHRSFESLSDALQALSRITALPVADKNLFKPGEDYQVGLRLSLDKGRLPKPFQLDVVGSRDWLVNVKVLRWKMTVAESK